MGMSGDNRNNGRSGRFASRALPVAALLVTAIFSATLLSGWLSSPESYSHQIERLDAKKETVMRLSVASATTSAVISMIPDDTCTPIANQLAAISKDFGMVLAAILLEKYLLTTLGFAFFGLVAPACLVALAVALVLPGSSRARAALFSGATRLLVAGLVVWACVPASVCVTDRIEETYEASITAAIDSADQAGGISEQITVSTSEPKGLLGRVLDVVTGSDGVVNRAVAKAGGLVTWAQTVLSNFTEGLAVMVVTTCVIPLLTPMLALAVVRLALEPVVSVLVNDN